MFKLEVKRSYIGKIIRFNQAILFDWTVKNNGFDLWEAISYSSTATFLVVGMDDCFHMILKPLCVDNDKTNIDKIPLVFNENLNPKYHYDNNCYEGAYVGQGLKIIIVD